MATLPSENTPKTDALGPTENADEVAKKRNKSIQDMVTSCKTYRRKLIQNWATNIDFRRGKPFSSQADEDRIAVNVDWSLTKQKESLLFSQVPAIRVNHPPHTTAQDVIPWIFSFEQRINDTANTAGIETAMAELMPDCINAAGIGVAMVSRDAIVEQVEVPAMDMTTLPPEVHAQVLQSGVMPDGTPVEMETIPREVDSRYLIARVSPSDFLWPIDFTGSDFDNASFVGRSGRIPWAEAQKRFNLNEANKSKYVSESKAPMDRLSSDIERDSGAQDDMVPFDEVFYREYQFNTDAKSFSTIHHLVWVGENKKPVIDEPWKGQRFDEESGQLIGALKYPIRVLALSYISDEAIPPSDSAIGRAQVEELNKGRTQMHLQREHSLPIRTADVNRVDPIILQALMKGQWQRIIPVQGNGQNVITEVSRAAMHQENFTFDRIAKDDLAESWQVGQGQTGHDIETKGEVEAIQGNMQTRISRERAKVGKFFCSIAEVLGGLICIYEDPSTFGEGFNPLVSRTLNYSILADSTVLLDSNQRLKRLMDFINFGAKSGYVNVEPVMKEIATLSGLDPNVVIVPPKPKPPAEPNISLRLSGAEDMMNPLMLAFLINSGQAPSAEKIEQAKKLIETAIIPPASWAEGEPPSIDPGTAPPAPGPGEANPNWQAMDRINKRTVER